jgi:hypothetical protein
MQADAMAGNQKDRQAGSRTGEQTRRLPYENRDMKADRDTGRTKVQSGRQTHRLDSRNLIQIYRQAYMHAGRDVHTCRRTCRSISRQTYRRKYESADYLMYRQAYQSDVQTGSQKEFVRQTNEQTGTRRQADPQAS